MNQDNKFLKLGPCVPLEGFKIEVAYEDSNSHLVIIDTIYDGRLTHRPEMKSHIWWRYIDEPR